MEGSEPEPGDLFLLRLMSPTRRWCRAHMGVRCGHGDIIHFQGKCLQLKRDRVCEDGRPSKLHQWAGHKGRKIDPEFGAWPLKIGTWAPGYGAQDIWVL